MPQLAWTAFFKDKSILNPTCGTLQDLNEKLKTTEGFVYIHIPQRLCGTLEQPRFMTFARGPRVPFSVDLFDEVTVNAGTGEEFRVPVARIVFDYGKHRSILQFKFSKVDGIVASADRWFETPSNLYR